MARGPVVKNDRDEPESGNETSSPSGGGGGLATGSSTGTSRMFLSEDDRERVDPQGKDDSNSNLSLFGGSGMKRNREEVKEYRIPYSVGQHIDVLDSDNRWAEAQVRNLSVHING